MSEKDLHILEQNKQDIIEDLTEASTRLAKTIETIELVKEDLQTKCKHCGINPPTRTGEMCSKRCERESTRLKCEEERAKHLKIIKPK